MHTHACMLSTEDSLLEPCHRSPPKTLCYHDFISHIYSHTPIALISLQDAELFFRVMHPYNTNAFKILLLKHNLLLRYFLLITNLLCNFALETLFVLTQSVLIKNHLSIKKFPNVIEVPIQQNLSWAHVVA